MAGARTPNPTLGSQIESGMSSRSGSRQMVPAGRLAGFGGFGRCQVNEIRCAINANGFTAWSHLRRNLEGCFAKAATHIEHARAGGKGLAPEQLVAVARQAEAQDRVERAVHQAEQQLPGQHRKRFAEDFHAPVPGRSKGRVRHFFTSGQRDADNG